MCILELNKMHESLDISFVPFIPSHKFPPKIIIGMKNI